MELMPIIRAQVTVPAASTVSEDAVTNTWHFTATGVGSTILDEIALALTDFYEDADAQKGDNQLWASAYCRMYNLDDPEPRIPIYDELLALTSAPASTALPPEICACISFNGTYVSGASQARRRGRIYFGPLAATVIDTTTGQLAALAVTNLATSAGNLLATSNLASDWAWVVYSPTGDTGYPVVEGWVDNAPDIQRGRGLKATVRTTF